jgi:hypothetical protein
MPPDGARGVPINAGLFARYAPTAEYLDEEVTLAPAGSAPSSVPATFDRAEGIVRVQPSQLLPETSYEIVWPSLRGLGTASSGMGATVNFDTGSSFDTEPPVFGGLAELSWRLERQRDECTDSLEERFVFDFTLRDGSDDGGRDSLTLILFQTKGPTIEPGAPQQIAVLGMPEADASLEVARRVGDATGDICFAAVVRDLTGRISSGAERELCTHTAKPPFFHGCRLAALGVPLPKAGSVPLVSAILLVAWRRRRKS